MVARVDITGNVYERLTVLEYIGDTKYRCQCSCGTVKDFYTQNLKRGLSKSCGCFNSDAVRARFAGHVSTFDQKEYHKQYREKNREDLVEKSRVYNAANKERISEGKRACYQKRRSHYLARVKAGYDKDPEAYITRERLKTTLKKEATPAWADKNAIKALYVESRRLTEETGVKHHVDHFYPLKGEVVCGLHCDANMRIITAEANWRKRNSVLDDWGD
jgi:hypothetical protein